MAPIAQFMQELSQYCWSTITQDVAGRIAASRFVDGWFGWKHETYHVPLKMPLSLLEETDIATPARSPTIIYARWHREQRDRLAYTKIRAEQASTWTFDKTK